jgi:putative SOS response-associated peptidase YedK
LLRIFSQKALKEAGEIVASSSVITHDAVESMGKIHDRMPAFLTKEESDI